MPGRAGFVRDFTTVLRQRLGPSVDIAVRPIEQRSIAAEQREGVAWVVDVSVGRGSCVRTVRLVGEAGQIARVRVEVTDASTGRWSPRGHGSASSLATELCQPGRRLGCFAAESAAENELAAWLQRYRDDDDEAALDELADRAFEHHLPRLLRHPEATWHDECMVREVAETTVRTFRENVVTFLGRTDRAILAWLWKTSFRRLMKEKKKALRRLRILEGTGGAEPVPQLIDVDQLDIGSLCGPVFDRLSEAEQRIFVAKVAGDFTHEELGESEGISPRLAADRYRRTCRRFRIAFCHYYHRSIAGVTRCAPAVHKGMFSFYSSYQEFLKKLARVDSRRRPPPPHSPFGWRHVQLLSERQCAHLDRYTNGTLGGSPVGHPSLGDALNAMNVALYELVNCDIAVLDEYYFALHQGGRDHTDQSLRALTERFGWQISLKEAAIILRSVERRLNRIVQLVRVTATAEME